MQIDKLDLVLEENSDVDASRSPSRYCYLLSCLILCFTFGVILFQRLMLALLVKTFGSLSSQYHAIS